MDWKPEQYLLFAGERTRPAIDLARRVPLSNPGRILDLGCGPGNSTAILARMWPEAAIVGLDSSEAMLEAARKTPLAVEWIHRDASRDLTSLGRFDLVFSNAALQWIPDTEKLVPRLHSLLTPGGALAVQVPYNRELPAFTIIRDLASREEWRRYFTDPSVYRLHHSFRFYYTLLCGLPGNTDMWHTDYIHVMDNHEAIAEWYKGAGLTPFLRRLPEDDILRRRFVDEYTELLRLVYPLERDGKVLFPFRRVFFVKGRP